MVFEPVSHPDIGGSSPYSSAQLATTQMGDLSRGLDYDGDNEIDGRECVARNSNRKKEAVDFQETSGLDTLSSEAAGISVPAAGKQESSGHSVHSSCIVATQGESHRHDKTTAFQEMSNSEGQPRTKARGTKAWRQKSGHV